MNPRRATDQRAWLGAAGLLALSLAAWSAARPAPARAGSEAVGPDRGERQPLTGRCARCHGEDGTGRSSRGELSEIPDFSSHRWQASRSDAELLVSILDGKGSHMPPYRDKLSERQARDLVAQVRALGPARPAGPAAGAAGDDFERRYRELQRELEELKRQFRELSRGPDKP